MLHRFRSATAWLLVMSAGCMQGGGGGGGGWNDPPPDSGAPNLSGVWRSETRTDGTNWPPEVYTVSVTQSGSMLSGTFTGQDGSTSSFTGSVRNDGSFTATQFTRVQGRSVSATFRGRLAAEEVTGRWAVAGSASGTFRWTR